MNHILHYTLSLFLLVCTIGCKKAETSLEHAEIPPITFEIPKIQHVSATGFSITTRVASTNRETVVDYGVILVTFGENIRNEEKISLGKALPLETIQFDYAPASALKSDIAYYIYFYAQTTKGYYKSHPEELRFNPTITVDVQETSARYNELITIQGDFKEVTEVYRLVYNNLQNETPYTISPDKKTLTFHMPKLSDPHGNIIEFSLVKLNETTGEPGRYFKKIYKLARVKIIATIDPIEIGQVFFNTPITLTGLNLPSTYVYNSDIELIVGNSRTRYQNPLVLKNIDDLSGAEFKMGYSVESKDYLFPNVIKLHQPDVSSISFSKSVVHPRSKVRVQGLNFDQYFSVSRLIPFIAGSGTFIDPYYNNDGFDTYIPEVPNGEYPLSLKTPFYGTLQTDKKIEVRNLVLTHINSQRLYSGEKATVQGSFIDGEYYTVAMNGRDVYTSIAENNIIKFTVPLISSGDKNITVTYQGNGKQQATGVLKVTLEKSTIDNISPLVAYVGDIITIKGKGLSLVEYATLGGSGLNIVSKTTEGIKFLVPFHIKKGKLKLVIQTEDYQIQSEEQIEIK